MDSHDDFSARFRALLGRHNVNLEVVAKAVGVSSALASKWKRGITEPRVREIAALCAFFGCSADHLVGRSQFVAGLAPDQFLLNLDALAEVERTGRKNRRVLIKVPQRVRLIGHKEAMEIVAKHGLHVE